MGKTFEEIGLDRSIQHIGVIMEKYDTDNYPRYELPEGFYFSRFKKGLEIEWVKLQYEVEQADNMEEAEETFYRDFLIGKPFNWTNPEKNTPIEKLDDFTMYPLYKDMYDKTVFVLDKDGKLAATAALWKGTMFGPEYQRIHWVAVSPKYNGLGLCKALITKVFDIYNELGYTGYIYLTSQTWSYKALSIYSKFGFKPYMGKKPEKWLAVNLTSGEFEPWDYEEKNKEAWQIIDKKINEYMMKNKRQ